MGFQRIQFQNAEGQLLSARLDLPADEKPKAYAVFAHCFACSKNLKSVVHINRELAMEGIAVLRFDFTGLGESEGDFGETRFSTNVLDLVSAAEYLKNNFEAPAFLIGHSFGGSAVLHAAGHIPSCRAVAVIAAPADPSDLGRLLVSARDEIDSRGEAEISIAGKSFRIRKSFMEDLEEVRMKEVLRKLGRALLVLHSPEDEVVGIRNAYEIFEAAEHPKSLISLDHADHLLSAREDSRYAGRVLAAWAGKYLGLIREPPRDKDLTDNRVRVRTGATGYQTEIIANGHRLIADEPIPAGGSDTGPTPYDYLVGALGACTSMTLRMYADRKKWPLEEVIVRLRHSKIHAKDCRECDTKEGRIDRIEREVEPVGPLSDEQRERLLEIANRCPVHRTLRSEINIESRLRKGP